MKTINVQISQTQEFPQSCFPQRTTTVRSASAYACILSNPTKIAVWSDIASMTRFLQPSDEGSRQAFHTLPPEKTSVGTNHHLKTLDLILGRAVLGGRDATVGGGRPV